MLSQLQAYLCLTPLLEVKDRSVPTVVTIVTLLIPLTDLLVDNDDVEVGVVVSPVLGPIHLPPDHLNSISMSVSACHPAHMVLQTDSGCFYQKLLSLVFCW
jgi:hypothetical protein